MYVKDGKLFSVGEQYSGELGYTTDRNLQKTFVEVHFDVDIDSIESFGDYTFALSYIDSPPIPPTPPI